MLEFFSDSGKLDYITIEHGIYTHKQIETRNGILFMRMKKRLLNQKIPSEDEIF